TRRRCSRRGARLPCGAASSRRPPGQRSWACATCLPWSWETGSSTASAHSSMPPSTPAGRSWPRGEGQERISADRHACRRCAGAAGASGGAARPLPAPEEALEWLATMTLIRRFEERAGEMYARAKVGGFLHLSIGEEATIVGSARALRDEDYLISTYRSHGHALVRGTPPENVMAEPFGRVDGCSRGSGGSMHMF